jgi:MFS family permease
MLTANSFAILSEAFPARERGKAFGMNSIVWGTGSILGIVLGGLIITFTSWRVIFLINVPIGIFGTVWAYSTLHESKASDFREETVDIPAALLFTLSLMSLLIGVTWGLLYGWGTQGTLLSLAVSPILFTAFILWEAFVSKDPIIDFDFFRNRTFTFSILSALLQSLALFSVNFLLIFYLEGIGGFTVLTASYLIVPMAIATSIVGPFGGLLTDRIGARYVATAGLAIQATVLFFLSRLTVSTPLIDVALLEAGFGVGGGLFWPANTSAIMSASPRGRFGAASGIMNTLRNTGMVLSFALTLTALTSALPSGLVGALFVGTYNGKLPGSDAISYLSAQSFAFEISVVLLLLCLVFSMLRGSPNPPPAKYTPSDSAPPATPAKAMESA